ncbi:MAG: peptidoglycan-binding domain-containing protein [Acidobacteriota bacterium]|nr:peptidoglycan-binding protein [Blastocatellia bacterium]MDW8239684.1 peptidoglycan-binding domain-containing protein [Acidobacteriota bacterium]
MMTSRRRIMVLTLMLALIAGLLNIVTTVDARRQRPELQLSRQTVRQVQQALKDRGYYDGAVDGIMGVRTRRAIQAFQQEKGLSATGRIDEQTLKKLGIPLKEETTRSGAGASIGGGIKKGAVTAATSTAKASTKAAKASADAGTVAATTTADAATTAGRATAEGGKKAGMAVKRFFTGGDGNNKKKRASRN